mgnify:CR=1 FL=1
MLEICVLHFTCQIDLIKKFQVSIWRWLFELFKVWTLDFLNIFFPDCCFLVFLKMPCILICFIYLKLSLIYFQLLFSSTHLMFYSSHYIFHELDCFHFLDIMFLFFIFQLLELNLLQSVITCPYFFDLIGDLFDSSTVGLLIIKDFELNLLLLLGMSFYKFFFIVLIHICFY